MSCLTDMNNLHSDVSQITADLLRGHLAIWLAASDASSNYNNAMSQRQKGTGEWILQNQRFHNWRQTPSSFLWLVGKAGCGKTIVTSTIIEYLHSNIKQNEHIVYFYFDFKDIDKQSYSHLLRSLLFQLCARDPSTLSQLQISFRNHFDGAFRLSDSTLQKLLRASFRRLDLIYVVIDAVDECVTPGEIIVWLQNLGRERYPNLRVFLSSRDGQDLQGSLASTSASQQTIALDNNANYDDIRIYISERLHNGFEFARWADHHELLDTVETILLQKADGM